MAARVKRTYNLTADTLRRVRELAARYSVADTQDGVVELAIQQLYDQKRAEQEAASWAEAASDPEFQGEMERIAEVMDRGWPG